VNLKNALKKIKGSADDMRGTERVFSISDDVLMKFPLVQIGVLVCRNTIVRKRDAELDELKESVIQEVVERFGSEPVTQHPSIRSWREMYRRFGTRPGDYRPSAEALLRRVLRSRGLPSINTAVDAYNAVSLRYLIPMGGFDLDKVVGDIEIRFADEGEEFIPIGASKVEETYEGEVVYSDDARIITRRWNHRDSDETKITEETGNVILFADGSAGITEKTVEMALEELASVMKEFCGGEITTSSIVDSDNRKLPI